MKSGERERKEQNSQKSKTKTDELKIKNNQK